MEEDQEGITDVDDDWMTPPPARGMRVRWPTVILLVLGLAATGFWIGAVVQKHDGASTSTAAAAFAGRRTAGGFGAGFGAGATGGGVTGGTATRGQVIDVAGPVVTITDTAGAIDRVEVGASTTVTRSAHGSAGSLQIGDTVVVRGTPGAGGVIAATSVVATAPGVTATGGAAAAGFAAG